MGMIEGGMIRPETMHCFLDDRCQSCGRRTCANLLVQKGGSLVCWKCYGDGWQDHDRHDCSCAVAMKIMIKSIDQERSDASYRNKTK